MTGAPLPVGADLGALHAGTQRPVAHRVLIATAVRALDPAEHATWMRAHRGGGSGAPSHDTDRLIASGLLAEVDDPAGFLSRYRLMPRFVGLGSETGERYGIGVPGLPPVATIDRAAFEVWEWAAVSPTLLVHCEVLATVDGTPGTEPASFAPAVLAAVRDLLEAGVAFLVPA